MKYWVSGFPLGKWWSVSRAIILVSFIVALACATFKRSDRELVKTPWPIEKKELGTRSWFDYFKLIACLFGFWFCKAMQLGGVIIIIRFTPRSKSNEYDDHEKCSNATGNWCRILPESIIGFDLLLLSVFTSESLETRSAICLRLFVWRIISINNSHPMGPSDSGEQTSRSIIIELGPFCMLVQVFFYLHSLDPFFLDSHSLPLKSTCVH